MHERRYNDCQEPISFGTALSDTFGYVFGGFSNLFSLSWVLFALVCLIAAFWIGAVAVSLGIGNEVPLYIAGALCLIGIVIAFFVYYILIARNFLFGEANPPVARLFWPTLGRGFLVSLLICAFAFVLLLPAMIAAGVGVAILYQNPASSAAAVLFILAAVFGIAGIVGVVYLVGRWATYLISTVAERPQSLREAWRTTAGAGFRILAGLLVVGLAFGAIDLALESVLTLVLRLPGEFSSMLTGSQPLLPVFVVLLGKIAIYFLQTAASAAYAGSVYRQILS